MSQFQQQSFSQRFHLDMPLCYGIFVLCGLGLFVLYSASGSDIGVVARQAIRMTVGFILMFSVAQFPPTVIKRNSLLFFILGIIILASVLWVGHIGKGAQRWLDLGLFRFQPSELMKLAVPMVVAWFMADKTLPPDTGSVMIASLLIILPVILIAKQPDLGTASLVAVSGFSVLFFARIRLKLMLIFSLILGVCTPIFWHFMHDYQKRRILTLFDYEQDPLGAGYHVIQSMIAVGSGGAYGKGWLNGTQSQLEFLPERSTDFIFAVYCEEFGLMGALFLLAIYLFIIGRCFHIVLEAQQIYEKLLGAALTLTLFAYVFINMGMVSGRLPIVGVPLPLISQGGSSMVTLMLAFGILMSMNTHRKIISG